MDVTSPWVPWEGGPRGSQHHPPSRQLVLCQIPKQEEDSERPEGHGVTEVAKALRGESRGAGTCELPSDAQAPGAGAAAETGGFGEEVALGGALGLCGVPGALRCGPACGLPWGRGPGKSGSRGHSLRVVFP